MRRRALLPALAGLPLIAKAHHAKAQPAWVPDHPIRLLVGFAAGGSTDTTGRVVAQALSTAFNQSVVVENRTGAGGNIASEYVAHSAPDGYTLVMGSMGTHATNQALYSNMGFHVGRDFAPLSLVARSANLLVAHPDFPARSVRDVIAMAKARPGEVTCGTAGAGSSQHLSMAVFEHLAGIRFNQVAYRGGAPAMLDLIGGRVSLVFAPVVESIQQVRAGQARALGITKAQRSPELPQVPPIREQLPGYEFTSWLGVFAPAGTPDNVVASLSNVIATAMRTPEMQARMAQLGYDAVGSTAEEFATFQAAEITRTAELVRLSGAKVE
jgi:tripartite-type tricarboxylate transporter receptor subunit TctC